jgi:hypothetical protein
MYNENTIMTDYIKYINHTILVHLTKLNNIHTIWGQTIYFSGYSTSYQKQTLPTILYQTSLIDVHVSSKKNATIQ